MDKPKITVGTTVALKDSVRSRNICPAGRKNYRSAVVIGCMSGDYSGGLHLDRDLGGCRYWNENDVIVVDKN